MQQVVVSDAESPLDLADFVRTTADRLLRAAVLMAGQREGADDLVQTVLERVTRRWGHLEDPQAFAMRVLANLIRDGWRRRQPLARIYPERPAVAEPAGSPEDRGVLVPALAALPARQRKIVVLRYLFDLSEKDTAEALGVSPGTVKSQASRGLARLRELLAEAGLEGGSHV